MAEEDDLAGAPELVVQLITSLEEQGWTLHRRDGRFGRRYWCPCRKQHNTWVTPNPKNEQSVTKLINHLNKMTCWEGGDLNE